MMGVNDVMKTEDARENDRTSVFHQMMLVADVTDRGHK